MAHMAKYTAQALAPMLAHYDRSRAANKDIDSSRTHLNYNLAPDRGNLLNFISKKCCEIKCQKRKDTIKLCDLVLTMPKDLPPEKEDIFFESSYIFLVNRYGVNGTDSNIVSCYVHKDESTSHMHFAFLPIAKEKKNKKKLGQLKLCAKEVITKQDLTTLHTDLQDYLERELGCKVSILNEATKDGNRSIADLKRDSQRTQANIDMLTRAEMSVERTKMGRGGIYGEDAVKMPVSEFDELTEMARRYSDVNINLKKLQDKRDANADAQARADELAKQLQQTQQKLQAQELELEHERKRARLQNKSDVVNLTSRIMRSGYNDKDVQALSYVNACKRAIMLSRATDDIQTIQDCVRYRLKQYYETNKSLDDDGALQAGIKAYYTYNGSKLGCIDNAVNCISSILPAMCCSDEGYKKDINGKLIKYAKNIEIFIKNEQMKEQIKAEVRAEKAKKKLLYQTTSKNQDRSR